uniref:Cell division protein n=1 Tax=Ourococcus multisporus TaxID=132186 RepID=A0A140GJ18_9CHLO|nr:cell division protein [Ourococcus multisporus]
MVATGPKSSNTNLFAKNNFDKTKTKTFSIFKELKSLQNQPLYLLKPIACVNFVTKNKLVKHFKPKTQIPSQKLNSLIEKRKSEKIFRTYFSVKSLEKHKKQLFNKNIEGVTFGKLDSLSNLSPTSNLSNLNLSKSFSNSLNSFQSIRPILKKLKHKVKIKRYFFKQKNKSLFNFTYDDFFVEFNKQENKPSYFYNKTSLKNFYKLMNSKTVLWQDSAGPANPLENKARGGVKPPLERASLVKQSVFNSKSFLRKFGRNLTFFKKADFSLDDVETKRLEKKKALQKKRRLKKLKLENRRRKKRKRFYPRPNYLRFDLYYSFLQKRHLTPFKNNFVKNPDISCLIQKSNPFNIQNKIKNQFMHEGRRVSMGRTLSASVGLSRRLRPLEINPPMDPKDAQKPHFIFFQEKIYRQQKQKWGNISSNLSSSEKSVLKKLPLSWTVPTYHQQEFYKISNETLAEFERLCWKSYWLRSNLRPYIGRIQQNLKKMQEKENLKQSQKTFSTILENLITWPIFRNNEKFLKFNNMCVKQRKAGIGPYVNIKETVDRSFLKNSTLTNFKNLENKAEYNRIIYERITDEIKNVKSQLNVDGQNHARSYKVGRQKIEKPISKNIWSSLNEFNNNFLEPKIKAFSIISVTNDSSIKPFGDLPTLRLLWACNKTNLFTYHENNFSRNLWSTYKNREQTKNNKTKKFLLKISKFYTLKPKTVETMSFNKTRLACKKIQTFGGFVYGKNYHSYLRHLKNKLQVTSGSKLELIKLPTNQGVSEARGEQSPLPNSTVSENLLVNKNKMISKSLKLQEKNWFDNNLGNKPQKRMIHFWWSTQQINPIEQILSFWVSSPTTFLGLDSYVLENTNSILTFELGPEGPPARLGSHRVGPSSGPYKRSTQIDLNKTVLITSFWVCCLLLHVSILVTIIRIPEIRSLAKFQFLILSKLANSYLICLFSISDLFKDYKTKINFLVKNAWRFSRVPKGGALLTLRNFDDLAFSQFKKFNLQNPEKNWIKQNITKLSYDRQLLTQQSRKIKFTKGDVESIKELKLSFQQNVKSTRKKLIQSTINFNFQFRNFIVFPEKIVQNSFGLNGSRQNTTKNFLVARSINPSSSPTAPRSSKNQNSKNWFYSWYTGFLWYTFSKSLNNSTFSKSTTLKVEMFQKKEIYLKNNLIQASNMSYNLTNLQNSSEISNEKVNILDKISKNLPKSSLKKGLKNKQKNFSWIVQSNIQLQSVLSLLTLYFTRTLINVFYFCFNIFYQFIFKLIDIMEGILLIFYKFLEKPAELMVEWIAEVFLIEWSSDLTTYIPEAFDTSIWNSVTKFSRSTRPLGGLVFGFTFQKIFLSSLEIFYSWVLTPDKDLILRQKKGVIFWDIWAEILIQAAEKYKMNLSSLNTLKEEQELLIENLLEEKNSSSKKQSFKLFQLKESTAGWRPPVASSQASLASNQRLPDWGLRPQGTQSVPAGRRPPAANLQPLVAEKASEGPTDPRGVRGLGVRGLGVGGEAPKPPYPQLSSPRDQRSPEKSSVVGANEQKLANGLSELIKGPKGPQQAPRGLAKAPGGRSSEALEAQETNFFKSEVLKTSLIKMIPLMKFLQTYPSNPALILSDFEKSDFSMLKNNSYKFFVSNAQLSNLSQLKIANQFSPTLIQKHRSLDSKGVAPQKRWSINQSLTTQGRDTDLFMDIHPPKAFLNISFLKTYLPAQEILGSLVCEIYSGLFTQKVSKNILVVGAPGTAKSFFIQALAGETELKIVTDNAHRYALVQGGVPVGMKLLREVFDSIALHTPCLFLLEDIHVIGERRPMLISDDENSKATDSTFGVEQEEVHEKNRLIYQLSRHSISHYKRPYKGDFSLSIPTNHFCYDLFLGISPPRKRRSGLTTKSLLPIFQLEKALTGNEFSAINQQESTYFDKNNNKSNNETLLSALQISNEQVFAPPATSPFNILLMKEQKKLKPKKLVKEMPWSGLSYDQLMLISKSHYSVRVKVALLAEMAMTNLSIKLDMITDLLVIIDSVRSNRGFVVFATTHLPSLLDPALRRPGRLDETISLPLLPNLISRFEIFKTNLSSYAKAMDFLDYSLFSSTLKQNENKIYLSISKSLLLLLNTKNSKKFNISDNLFKPRNFGDFFNDYPIYSVSQAFQTSMGFRSLLINISQFRKCLIRGSKDKFTSNNLKFRAENLERLARKGTKAPPGDLRSPAGTQSVPGNAPSKAAKGSQKLLGFSSNNNFLKTNLYNLLNQNVSNSVLSGTDKLNYVSLIYSQAGQFLVESLIIHDQTTYSCKFSTHLNQYQEIYNTEEQIFKNLYNSKIESKNTLLKLFAGKISEFFVLNNFYPRKLTKFNNFFNSFSENNSSSVMTKSLLDTVSVNKNKKQTLWFKDEILSSEQTVSLSIKKDWWLSDSSLLETNPSQSSLFENVQNFQAYWQSATDFLDSLFQKRYLYNKSSIVSKLLFFEDSSSLREPPNPPNSSILMPAKKFENYQRTLKDFIQKPILTINEKIQMHQKQRFLKLLYNVSVQTSFPTVSQSSSASKRSLHVGVDTQRLSSKEVHNQKTSFYNSFKELGYLDLLTLKPTASYCFYKNHFLIRHRFSFLNQWWNGQLAEHNVETTYLSHVDWRSMFVQSMGDITIDFPDADQYYNPRSKRWFLHSTSWNYWLSFENNRRQEISQHYILYCFTKTSHLLNLNRELFDYLAFRFLRYHQLKEIDLLQILSRFYKTNEVFSF